MVISPSRDVVVSLFRDLYSKSFRLGGFKSVENYLRHFFRIKNSSASENIFLLTNLFYNIDIHMVHGREKCTPLHSYISRVVN